ncbi:hypothetical protein ES708_17852 [subsurface metagenome]
MKKKTKKERTAKVKINERRALDLLTNYVDGRIKPKDQEERKLLNQLLTAAIKRLAPGEEGERTLPAIKEINPTPADLKEIVAGKPPTSRYLEVPLEIINAAELTRNQEGENGSLIEEYYQDKHAFIESPRGPLTLLGKKMFYGILPNLKKEHQGKRIIKFSKYDIIKKMNPKNPKPGGSTYKEINQEYHKIRTMQLYHPEVTKDNGKTYFTEKWTPLFLYAEKTGKKGEEEKYYLLWENPILKGSILDQYKANYHLDNVLKATNKHEIALYLFLKTKLKPGEDPFPIGEDKLIRHADIHAKEKIHQRRDLKIALENLEKDYGFLCGKNKNNTCFPYLPKGTISKEERDRIVQLLNQGKTPTGKNILEQRGKDQEERMRNQGRRIRTQRRAQKMGVTDDTLIFCYGNYTNEEIEKQVNLLAERNPKNPNPLLKAALKGHYTIPGKRDREDEEARQARARIR